MDMKQLTTFVTLAHTLNYQKAADLLQYAPSTLFKHIQLLEQELGVTLFSKTGRQLILTAEGGAFREHAERILEHYDHAVASVTDGEKLACNLTIGGCEINTANSLLTMFTQFSGQYPGARLNMLTSPNASVPSLVKSDMIDVGYYYSLSDRGCPGLQSTQLYREPIFLMAARSHPAAGREKLHYEDLAGMNFAYPHDTCCFVTEFLFALRKRGVELGKSLYLGNMYLVIEQVQQSGALTLVPQSTVQRFKERYDMTVLDMDEAPILAYETVVYKNYEALRPIAKTLLRHSVHYAEKLQKAGVVM